jgi:hypothetical protein
MTCLEIRHLNEANIVAGLGMGWLRCDPLAELAQQTSLSAVVRGHGTARDSQHSPEVPSVL